MMVKVSLSQITKKRTLKLFSRAFSNLNKNTTLVEKKNVFMMKVNFAFTMFRAIKRYSKNHLLNMIVFIIFKKIK